MVPAQSPKHMQLGHVPERQEMTIGIRKMNQRVSAVPAESE